MEQLRRGDPEVVGPYHVLSRLGSGAMGQVFLAESDGRPVAVKVIQPGLAEERQFRSRFRHEVRAAQRVSGPYTAAVLAADPDGEPAWMATEYIPGPTMQQLVEDQGPLTLKQVAQLAADIAAALMEIHDAGVVHRDLKPTNVVVPPDGSARVIDFGIARAAEATVMTATGLSVGSVGYMSPEQAEAGKVGPAADVFALGALLYFAATGELVFGTGSAASVMYRVVHKQADLSAVANPGLRSLITACLAKSPDERPSADAVRAACVGGSVVWADRAGIAKEAGRHPAPTEVHPAAQPTQSGAGPIETNRRVSRRLLPLVLAALLGALAVGGAAWLFTGRSAVPSTAPSTAGGTASAASPEPPPLATTPPPSTTSPPQSTMAPTSPPHPPIDAPPARRGKGAEIMWDAPEGSYGPCLQTGRKSRYGGYPEAECYLFRVAYGHLYGERATKDETKGVACQKNLGRKNKNHVYDKDKKQTNTWWVWTASDNGTWDWFPATAIAQGASDEPINGIALCQ